MPSSKELPNAWNKPIKQKIPDSLREAMAQYRAISAANNATVSGVVDRLVFGSVDTRANAQAQQLVDSSGWYTGIVNYDSFIVDPVPFEPAQAPEVTE